jgi:hypothetical protein
MEKIVLKDCTGERPGFGNYLATIYSKKALDYEVSC